MSVYLSATSPGNRIKKARAKFHPLGFDWRKFKRLAIGHRARAEIIFHVKKRCRRWRENFRFDERLRVHMNKKLT